MRDVDARKRLRGAAAPPRLPRRAHRASPTARSSTIASSTRSPRARAAGGRAVRSTSTTSSPSTTAWATAAATTCCIAVGESAAARVSRRTDTVARLGGDEFGVLLEDVAGPNEPVQVAQRILGRLRCRRRRPTRSSPCWSASASASAARRAASRSCCAAPTSRCTRPSAPASAALALYDPATRGGRRPPSTSAVDRPWLRRSDGAAAECVSLLERPDGALRSSFSPSSTCAPGASSATRRSRASTAPCQRARRVVRAGASLRARLRARGPALAAALAVAGPPRRHLSVVQPQPVLARPPKRWPAVAARRPLRHR